MVVIRFGAFELDEVTGELRENGRRVHLAPQPSKLLYELARRSGELVTRDQVRHLLWGDETHVAFDQGLNFCLTRIRLALGDSARHPRFVETIPRSGYRFLASVEVLPPPARPLVHRTHEEPSPNLGGGRNQPRAAASVALAVAVLLALLAGGSGRAHGHSRLNAAPGAVEAFERGKRLVDNGPEGLRWSIDSFREAVRGDPQFAEAHYTLARALLSLAERGEVTATASLPEARREAEAALALHDEPMARLIVASVRYYHDWDWIAARRDMEAALRAAPDSDAVLKGFARYLSALGADDEAIRAIDLAEARAPSCDLVAHESGLIRYRARRYGEAIRKFDRSSELASHGKDPIEWRRSNRMLILRVHLRSHAWEDGRLDALEIMRLSGEGVEVHNAIAALPARQAVDRFLARWLDSLRKRAEHEYIPLVDMAEIHAWLGDRGASLDLLERAAADREPSLAYSLRDPDFDDLHSEPRYLDLLARVGLPTPVASRIALLEPPRAEGGLAIVPTEVQ